MCMSREAMGAPSSGSSLSACMAVADSPGISYLTYCDWRFSIENVS